MIIIMFCATMFIYLIILYIVIISIFNIVLKSFGSVQPCALGYSNNGRWEEVKKLAVRELLIKPKT